MVNLNDTDLSDPSKYRLIGDSVLSYRFAIPYQEALYVGDILKITDREKDLTFLAKVTDLLHESNFEDEKWDRRPHTEQFYGLSEDVYLVVEALPLGFVDGRGIFRRPRTVPTKFSRVEMPEARDFAFLQQVMGDIQVGVMKTGQGVLRDVRVALHSRVMPQHMGVFATTGMGKSNFMKVFCASCMKARQFGLLLVDPHGEYVGGKGVLTDGQQSRGLAHFQAGRDGLAIFTIRDEKFRKTYSAHSLFLEHDDFRAPDLLFLFDHSPAQREVIEILEDTRGSELVRFFRTTEFDDQGAWAAATPHRDLARRLQQFSPSTLSVMKRRIEILARNNPFLREKGSSVPEILKALDGNRVVIIDIPNLGERSELFVLSVLARTILGRHRGEAQGWGVADAERRDVLITIEEAQRVLGSGSTGTQVFRECAMEGRKFGVGLCVVTQQPKNIDPRVLAQLNTYVVMGLSDRGDRDMVAGHAKQDLSRMDTEIQTLEPGEAIISTLGIPFPVSTRIHLFEEYVQDLNRETRKPITEGLENRF